jgi:hypothetical protein
LDKNFNISNLAPAQERKDDLNKNFSAAVEYALKNKPEPERPSNASHDREAMQWIAKPRALQSPF